MTPSESAGSALMKKKHLRKTTTKQCETAQSAKRFPVESQIVSIIDVTESKVDCRLANKYLGM